MTNPSTTVEHREAIETLEREGFAPLLAALSEPTFYTRAGRPIVNKIAREMKVTARRVRMQLEQAREILGGRD